MWLTGRLSRTDELHAMVLWSFGWPRAANIEVID